MKTLFKNARILKMDDSPIFEGDLLVENNKIVKICKDIECQDADIIECNGNVLMPGFKNAHAHSAMTFLRSRTDNLNLHDWLFNEVFPREDCLIPEDIYHLSKVAFLEYLSSGITSVFDHYWYPLSTAKAANEIGVRTLILGTITSYCNSEELKTIYHSFNDNPDSLVKYTIGTHSEYAVSDNELFETLKVIKELKSPFFTHVSETKNEVHECTKRRMGLRPTEFFIKNGFYDYGGGAYHCVYFNDNDIKEFKNRNLSVVTCPGSNSKLASGIAPVEDFLNKGLNVAIGTDGPASNNCLDMFKEMSLVSSLSKLFTENPASLSAHDILKMATVNGAKAMRQFDCDILEEGKLADIIMLDLTRPSMQPINNIETNIVYSGGKDIIKMTMINGKILYKDGKFFVGEDITEIYKKAEIAKERIESEYKKRNNLQ